MQVARSLVGLVLVLVTGTSLLACSSPRSDQTGSANPLNLEQREANLRELAAGLGLDEPPSVDLVRFVAESEWTTVQLGCLNDLGYPVVAMPDGRGIDSSMIPASQAARGGPYALAVYTCQAQYSMEPSTGELTEEELGELYDWYLGVEVPCLEEHGAEVSDPPSRASFIETYNSNPWIPFGAIDHEALGPEKIDELLAECPQSPADVID